MALKFVEIIAILGSKDERAVDAGDWVLVSRSHARVSNSKPITLVASRDTSLCMVFTSLDRFFAVNAKTVDLKLKITIHTINIKNN